MGLLSFMWGAAKAADTIRKGPAAADKTPAGAALAAEMARIVRWTNGESVGVSLSGGGAWGMGHIGLLRRLRESGLPVDYVAGVSSGSIVAGMFAWRPKTTLSGDGLDEIEAHEREALPMMASCIVSLVPLRRWIEALTGGTNVGETAGRFLAFHATVMDGGYVEAASGSIGLAMTASSAFAPLFAPMDYGGDAILDGGYLANLPPCTAVWASGSQFFVTSNVIPTHPGKHPPVKSAVRQWLVEHVRVARRVRDFSYGVMHLFHRVSDLDTEGTDLHFEADLHCWGVAEFDQMKAIAERALHQAREHLSGQRDPSWAYWLWMYTQGTTTGTLLGPPPPPPAPLPAAPVACPP